MWPRWWVGCDTACSRLNVWRMSLAQVKLVHELQRSHRFVSVFFCHPSLTSVASLEHCVQCQDPWATSRAKGGDVMWHWNHKTKVPVWCNGGVYHTTQCVLHCSWLGGCDTQLLWTLLQLVRLVDMAVLTVRLQVWETLKIHMPSHEVEETHKHYTRM